MNEQEAKRQRISNERRFLIDSLTPNTFRYAGAAIAASLLPGIGSMVDDQEEGILNNLLAGGILATGVGGGYMLGDRAATFKDDASKHQYVRKAVDDLRQKARAIRDVEGPEVANAYFGQAKRELMASIEPISEMRVKQIDKLYEKGKFPKRGADTIYGKAPRQVEGRLRGAALGALAAALPAYLAMRGGDIE